MKKKMKDQQEGKERIFSKTTDNKENTLIPNDNYEYDQEISSSVDTPESESDGDTAIETSDNGEDEVKVLIEKLAEMQDKYIRLSAEFDNYRKRTLREKMDLSKYAGENLLIKILPIIDDFERALQHMDMSPDCIAVTNGIDLIYVKLSDFLKQNGVKEIESLNSDFNVDLHEAVAKVSVQEDDKKGKIVDVLEKGYYLHDKILRFSKVVVGE